MIKKLLLLMFLYSIALACSNSNIKNQNGVELITPKEVKHHLDFLASDELLGRNTPSNELKIASKYLALMSKKYGLKPIMENGSYFQNVPLETSKIIENETQIVINGNEKYHYQSDFRINQKIVQIGSVSGEILFLGYGLHAPEVSWDDIAGKDMKNKIVIILDADLPKDNVLRKELGWRKRRQRGQELIQKGVIAVFSVISEYREEWLLENAISFDNSISSNYIHEEIEAKTDNSNSYNVELRHDMACKLLGISNENLLDMFEKLRNEEQVKGFDIKNKTAKLTVNTISEKVDTRNVIASIEGSDPKLKNEYVVLGAHYDHLGVMEGKIYNGASDNASGSVALLAIAKAMISQNPKRSVLFVWFTGEEKGLWGSKEFVYTPPVPLENISACINLDVLIGDKIDVATPIGDKKLSSELEEIMLAVNEEYMDLTFDYSLDHPSSFLFFSSDHYPFLRNGIPAVWLGSETDGYPHIHQPTDDSENTNGEKICVISKLAYYMALEIANKDEMLKLDLNPEITSRGKHNLSYDWMKEKEE